jgi:hypothetical protein
MKENVVRIRFFTLLNKESKSEKKIDYWAWLIGRFNLVIRFPGE